MMKKTCILAGLLFNFYILDAQDKAAIEARIRELEQMSVKAILDADTVTFKKIWALEFLVNTPRNNVAANRDSVLSVQRAGLINYSAFTRTIEQIQIHDDLSNTIGHESFVPKANLPQAGQTIKRRFINVWRKQGGQWLHIARQASIICPQ